MPAECPFLSFELFNLRGEFILTCSLRERGGRWVVVRAIPGLKTRPGTPGGAACAHGPAAGREAEGAGERSSRSAGARLAARQGRGTPDAHQRYFDHPDGG